MHRLGDDWTAHWIIGIGIVLERFGTVQQKAYWRSTCHEVLDTSDWHLKFYKTAHRTFVPLEFICDFIIFFKYSDSYLNSYVMKCSIRIHDHEEYSKTICQNSYLWIHLRIHDLEFKIIESYTNSSYEPICEFSAVKNIMKSWLNSYKWIHKRNHHSIMAEFIILRSIFIGYEFFNVRNIYSSNVIMTTSLQSAHCLAWGFTGEDSAEECFPPCCWLTIIGMYGGMYCGMYWYVLTWYVLWHVLVCIIFGMYYMYW